jgi:hypothetical protein
MRKRIVTQEQKVAQKLEQIVSDVRLDLDLVGMYLGKDSPNVTYRRLQIIAESAEQEKEGN